MEKRKISILTSYGFGHFSTFLLPGPDVTLEQPFWVLHSGIRKSLTSKTP